MVFVVVGKAAGCCAGAGKRTATSLGRKIAADFEPGKTFDAGAFGTWTFVALKEFVIGIVRIGAIDFEPGATNGVARGSGWLVPGVCI